MPEEKPTSVREIAASLSIRELAMCAKDVLAWQQTNILAEGALRSLAQRLQVDASYDEMSALQQAEAAVLREICVRFVTAAENSPDLLAPKPLHPEQLDGEVHLCNLDTEGARVVGWKTKRVGEQAYGVDGAPDVGKVPVFVAFEELNAAGQWDPRYTVKQ